MTAAPQTPDLAAQFRATGFILSEDAEYALRELFAAMEASAIAYDMDVNGTALVDITGEQVAVQLRTFARLGKMLVTGIPYASDAPTRPTGRKRH
ncbi:MULTISPECIES: hypothetical protein [unclassified Sphingomonas]|jgi:hypothetical protein|uniref:hypothetical protein n=1 Tax=Novosphingobium rhizosphaerae TaxID=1551649 RepID=UPI0015CD6926